MPGVDDYVFELPDGTRPKPGPPGQMPSFVQSSWPRTNPPSPSVNEPGRPVPDGWITLRSVAGTEHVYNYRDMPKGWRPYNRYLSISTPTGWVNWAWGSIMRWETHNNSAKYRELKREYDRLIKLMEETDADADGS